MKLLGRLDCAAARPLTLALSDPEIAALCGVLQGVGLLYGGVRLIEHWGGGKVTVSA